jgi:hypothetical protein
MLMAEGAELLDRIARTCSLTGQLFQLFHPRQRRPRQEGSPGPVTTGGGRGEGGQWADHSTELKDFFHGQSANRIL